MCVQGQVCRGSHPVDCRSLTSPGLTRLAPLPLSPFRLDTRPCPFPMQYLLDPPRTAPAGCLALLKDKTGDILAKGYYEPGER